VTKAALRKIYKNKRKQISLREMQRWSDLILINFQKLDLPFIDCVHTYLAIEEQNEVDTLNIIRYLKFKNPGIKVVVPKINLDAGEMKHYIFNDESQMSANSFGIVEPVNGEKVMAAEIDLVLTPLLAFDKKGYRVGYGKGFYDSFFKQCKPGVLKIGVSFFEPEEIIEDINSNDVALDDCVTPYKIYTFKD
jgi:5-formyltetrahydrofolate cyclo-ligase